MEITYLLARQTSKIGRAETKVSSFISSFFGIPHKRLAFMRGILRFI